MKGPAIFLAQFLPPSQEETSLRSMCEWASNLGYEGVQIPTWDARIFDLKLASESQQYCDQVLSVCHDAGVQISELSTHLQGQLVASHARLCEPLNSLCPEQCSDDVMAQRMWAREQLLMAAKASQRLKLTTHATFLVLCFLAWGLPLATASR